MAPEANAERLCREFQRSHARRVAPNEPPSSASIIAPCGAIAEWAEGYNHFRPHSSLRISDPGRLCRDHRRNRLQRCAR
ncbi:hypothetical protein ACOJBO_02205 [Rhizobium beringeri]